jgi:ribose/xylose/arabinose/galactoside ABC-type transport system permease subunit
MLSGAALTSRDQGRAFKSRITDLGLILVILILGVFFSIKSPYFLSFSNFMNMMISVSVIGIAATAITTTIIARGPDLTTGAMMALSSCLAAILVMQMGLPWYIGISASLLTGVLVGSINGMLITRLKISSLVVTLGMMSVVRGVAFIATGGLAIFISSQELNWFGIGYVGKLPVPVIIMALSFVVFALITKFTVFGRKIYACGGNAVASRLVGINVNRIVTALFMVSGFMSALAGLVMLGITSAALPSSGESYNFDVMTAVLLGGTALDGGEGSVSRTFLGLLVIGIINNGMALLNVPSYWQTLAKGVLLIIAVVADKMRRR